MVLLAVTADTWIVTGLGFGIVLALLFCLVFILQGFGFIMQKATAPKVPKEGKKEATGMIAVQARETAWNPKSEGFTNIGF